MDEVEHQLSRCGLISLIWHFDIQELLDKSPHQPAHFFDTLNIVAGEVYATTSLSIAKHGRTTLCIHQKKKKIQDFNVVLWNWNISHSVGVPL